MHVGHQNTHIEYNRNTLKQPPIKLPQKSLPKSSRLRVKQSLSTSRI